MSRSSSADSEKDITRRFVRRLLGEVRQPVAYRPDWLITTDGAASVFITYAHDDGLFYDVSDSDLTEWSRYQRAFVVFLMGCHSNGLVVPVSELRLRLASADRIPSAKYGDFKLHVVRTNSGLAFREIEGWELSGFLNNYFSLVAENTTGH